MQTIFSPLAFVVCSCALLTPALPGGAETSGGAEREVRRLAGWTVRVQQELLAKDEVTTERALELLKAQLEEIVRVVPATAVAELQKVPLWISSEYPEIDPRAEYHPDAGWLRANGRDPAMAKSVEFTNVRIFEAETRRMPNFALHELAHAYHDRVLGFDEPRIVAAFASAKAGGRYDDVQRRDAAGRSRRDRAYAMTSHKEYFAECTEAFFTRNDFFPFTRDELKQHDPAMFELLAELWGEPAATSAQPRKTAAAIDRAPVDFNHPPREYEESRVGAWPLLVEKELATAAPELAKRAAARLGEKLGAAMAALPATARPRFETLKFFLMHGPRSKHGGRDNGLEYFQVSAPAAFNHLDPRMAGSIVVYSASNYAELSDFWALKAVVHELAHAFHLQQWPEDRRDIYEAWRNATKLGLYRKVKDDQGRLLDKAYAAQNHLEYFAELSCAYFVGCNYAPFNRAELKEYDPAGFTLIESLWQTRTP